MPITERYIIGGIYDVRGYAPRSLGPRLSFPGLDPDNTGRDCAQPDRSAATCRSSPTAEIEFPLFERVGISGVVFFDMGNAFNLENRHCSSASGGSQISVKFDPCFLQRFPDSLLQGLRRSVGFGFRWFSPIGPLRFEWGIPLDRQKKLPEGGQEDSLVFEFTIGNFF